MTGVAGDRSAVRGLVGDRSAVHRLDLGDDRMYASTDPEPMWREMVERDAAVWTGPSNEHNGFWSVFSYAACNAVLSADGPFTSEYGMFIGFDRRRPDSGGGRMIVVSEGRWHEHLRSLLGTFFSRAMSGPLQASIAAEVRALLAEARENPTTDVAGRFASWLPNAVVCEILDVPVADREWLGELTHFAVGAPDEPAEMSASTAHSHIMFAFAELIRERQRRPGEDLISHLLGPGRMEPSDVLINCDNVFAAGNATTQHSIAGSFHALATAPEVLDALRADPRALRLAVEEVLRWTTPGPHVLRVATEDVSVNGQVVTEGTPVVTWLAAANRDARVFLHPERFSIDRNPNRHLSFGRGLHYCLGAATARMEVRLLLEHLAETARTVNLVEEPQRLRSTKVNGYRHLRVGFDWR